MALGAAARSMSRDEAGSRCAACDVRDLSVCRAIDVQKLPLLSAIAQCRRLEAGRLLFAEGEVAEDVHTLTSGMLKLYKLMQDGRRQVLGFMVPGDFLGLAFGRTYAYSAEAITPAAACHFPRARFFRLLEEFPSLEKEILGRTSTELAAAQDQMLLLGRKTARERLASFLLRLAERRGEHDGPIELPMSRGDFAELVRAAWPTCLSERSASTLWQYLRRLREQKGADEALLREEEEERIRAELRRSAAPWIHPR